MRRHLVLAYGCACYLLALGTLVYLFLFIGNIGIERSIDAPARMNWLPALCIDIGLLLTFALTHSLLARNRFKAAWKRWFPAAIERSNYILVTCASLLLVFLAWQPLDTVLWRVESVHAVGLSYGMFVFGWLTVLVAISLTNHFDLFGVRQVWLAFTARHYRRLPFTTRWLYRYVRHPLYLGWLFAFWAAPVMTLGHVLFAGVLTVYIVIAIPWEERDLIDAYGKRYLEYRERVPKLIPSISRSREQDAYVLNSTGEYVGPDDIKAP